MAAVTFCAVSSCFFQTSTMDWIWEIHSFAVAAITSHLLMQAACWLSWFSCKVIFCAEAWALSNVVLMAAASAAHF